MIVTMATMGQATGRPERESAAPRPGPIFHPANPAD
jgi:hypothetical protein